MRTKDRHLSRAMLFAGFLVLMAASPVLANTISVDVGNYYFSPGLTKAIAIYATGNVSVSGLNLFVQLGDGGTAVGGTDTAPLITAVDVVGPATLFFGNNSGATIESSALLWAATTTTASGMVNVSGSKALACVTIDATGATLGKTYGFRLTDTAAGDTGFADDSLSVNITNGSIKIVLPGDTNGDGTVNSNDLGLFLTHYNQTVPTGVDGWTMGDYSGDGTVNSNDLGFLLTHYNQSTYATSVVPEPSCLLLAALGLLGLFAYARRWRTK